MARSCNDYPRCIREEDEKYVIGKWGEYKVPFTFATNGRPYLEQYKTKSGIWFLDLRKPDNSPMALHGWMSPDGMEELLEADVDSGNKELKEMPYDLLTDKDGLNLRPYQLNAIKAAEEAVISGKQTALLAMATGTGKTRTVLGMIYRFLKTERFRRILFLVDRTALGEQAQDVFEEVKMEDLLTLDDIYNINIDCVGAKSAGPLALKNISRIEDSSILYDSLKETLKENNIEYSDTFSTDKVEYFYNNNSGVSDYFSFEKNGIPNIHIAQQGISDLILNDNDNPENLDFNKIDILGDTLAKFIQQINLDSQ